MNARTQTIMAQLRELAKPRHPTPTGERIGLIGVSAESGEPETLQIMERYTDGHWRAQPTIRYSWSAAIDAGVGELVTAWSDAQSTTLRAIGEAPPLIDHGEVLTADHADRSITASNGFGERRAYIRTIGDSEGYSR